MKTLKPARHFVEALLACLASWILPFLPRNAILGMSKTLGNTAFRCCRQLRSVAMANLDIAFGNSLSFEEKEAIIKDSFRTFTLVLIDLFWFGRSTAKRIQNCVKFDPSFDHYLKTNPAIIISGHFGNWEVMGLATALHGAPSMSVAMPLANPFVDSILNRLRRVTGQQIVTREGAVRKIITHLKSGGKTGMLMDQNTLPNDGGEFVPFFNLPVPVSKAASSLARRTDAAIVFAFCLLDQNGNYTLRALPPIRPEPGDQHDLTPAIARIMEELIRQHPGQWLWMYKRWKFIPADSPPDNYPFYARPVKPED
jgi:KDO2-lipid IV(A) lauroyltransferase